MRDLGADRVAGAHGLEVFAGCGRTARAAVAARSGVQGHAIHGARVVKRALLQARVPGEQAFDGTLHVNLHAVEEHVFRAARAPEGSLWTSQGPIFGAVVCVSTSPDARSGGVIVAFVRRPSI